MTEQDTLLGTILSLINRRTEGPHWDFKIQHHGNKAELLHDVLCLANVDFAGPRYLVFGVNNESYTLHSLAGTQNRRSQADIVNLFRDNSSKFFQFRTPTFYLTELQHEGKTFEVLAIEDKPHKPYYLVDEYRSKGSKDRTVRAHHIYTRIGDTNTPLPDTAPPHEIERMWRERFGLDRPPLERAKRFLLELDSWLPMSEDEFFNVTFYHKVYPEFTLRTAEASEIVARHEEWTRGEIRTDNNDAGVLQALLSSNAVESHSFCYF